LKRTWITLGSALLAVTLALAGCGGSGTGSSSSGSWYANLGYKPYQSKPTNGGVFRIAFQTDIPELDPLTWTDLQSMYPMDVIYDTLVRYSDDGTNLVPDLATWQVSPDGKVYTFFLRHGVRFSNGDPLTAADVKYSLERLTSHANAGVSGYGSYFAMIQGYDAWHNGTASDLSGVQVVNPYELRITLSYPAPYFLNDLALMAAGIVDPAVVNKWGNQNYSHHAVGSGPFMLQSWTPNKEMILVPNPLYWGPKPHLKEIDIKIGPDPSLALEQFQRGQLDETTEITSQNYLQIEANPALKALYHRVPMNGIYFVYLNCKEGPTANVLVRQAINYAINKKQLIATLTNGRGGVVNDAVLPPRMPGYDPSLPPLYPYNLAKAKQLMAEAGYKKGFTLRFVGWTDPTTTMLADFLQSQLKQIGINVQISTMTYPQFLQQVANPKNFGMAEYAWYQDYPDPQDFFDALFNQNAFGATNFTYWSNPTVQHDIVTADQLPASQNAERYQLYRDAQKIIAENAPVIWEYYAWNDEVVQPWVGPNDLAAWGLGPIYPIEFWRVWIGKH
jgi:ABC-type transport system substrate-binding protein